MTDRKATGSPEAAGKAREVGWGFLRPRNPGVRRPAYIWTYLFFEGKKGKGEVKLGAALKSGNDLRAFYLGDIF